MGREEAETLALEALSWIGRQEDLMRVFLGSTGLSAADLTARAGDPDLLAGVLDFLLMDDAWVTDFAASVGVEPAALHTARMALPGGAVPDWT